jgi:hypothetical protein
VSEDLAGTYWYCVKHHRVEQFEATDSHDRIGPFDDEQSAASALQIIADREKRYEQEDSAWEESD